MRRTKVWWARLTPEERKFIVAIERSDNLGCFGDVDLARVRSLVAKADIETPPNGLIFDMQAELKRNGYTLRSGMGGEFFYDKKRGLWYLGRLIRLLNGEEDYTPSIQVQFFQEAKEYQDFPFTLAGLKDAIALIEKKHEEVMQGIVLDKGFKRIFEDNIHDQMSYLNASKGTPADRAFEELLSKTKSSDNIQKSED